MSCLEQQCDVLENDWNASSKDIWIDCESREVANSEFYVGKWEKRLERLLRRKAGTDFDAFRMVAHSVNREDRERKRESVLRISLLLLMCAEE